MVPPWCARASYAVEVIGAANIVARAEAIEDPTVRAALLSLPALRAHVLWRTFDAAVVVRLVCTRFLRSCIRGECPICMSAGGALLRPAHDGDVRHALCTPCLRTVRSGPTPLCPFCREPLRVRTHAAQMQELEGDEDGYGYDYWADEEERRERDQDSAREGPRDWWNN